MFGPVVWQPVSDQNCHACPNDCILFRGDFAERPMCESRRGTIPNKTFIYMPLGPRLERIFSTSNLAAHGYSPSSHQSYDIHDSRRKHMEQMEFLPVIREELHLQME